MTDYKTDPLPFDELLSLPSYSMITLSKNKDKLAFFWDKTGRIELYVMDFTTKEIEQISFSEKMMVVMNKMIFGKFLSKEKLKH